MHGSEFFKSCQCFSIQLPIRIFADHFKPSTDFVPENYFPDQRNLRLENGQKRTELDWIKFSKQNKAIS